MISNNQEFHDFLRIIKKFLIFRGFGVGPVYPGVGPVGCTGSGTRCVAGSGTGCGAVTSVVYPEVYHGGVHYQRRPRTHYPGTTTTGTGYTDRLGHTSTRCHTGYSGFTRLLLVTMNYTANMLISEPSKTLKFNKKTLK